MTAPESILQKIKLLQRLATSPNKNEADVATAMVEKLIVKYNISTEEMNSIADKLPAYGDDELLFETSYIVGWMTQLSLAISNKYDCQIVQETITPVGDGAPHYNYFLYGAPEDVEIVKFVWAAFSKKVEEWIVYRCTSRGPIFISSYTEGLVQSIKLNLQFDDLILPKIIKPDAIVKDDPTEIKADAIEPAKVEREKPTENRIDVKAGTLIKDIMAYFKGVEDGKDIHSQSVVDEYYAAQQTKKVQNEQQINQETSSS